MTYKYYIICPTYLPIVVIKSRILYKRRPTLFHFFYFFLVSFLKKSSQIPRVTRLPDCSTPSDLFQLFSLHISKHRTLTLRTDPRLQTAAQRDPPPRRRATAITGLPPSPPPAARRLKLKIRSKQISNLCVLHSLILSLLLFF